MCQHSDSLAHYGVKGMKKGLRRFQNEDGTLTAEGRSHYGIGEERIPGRQPTAAPRVSKEQHNYRVRKYGKQSAKVLERKPKQMSPQEKAARDAKRKKIIAAAALTAVAAIGIGVAVKQRSKTTRNLIEMAKNKVHKEFVTKQNELDRRVNLTKNERQGEQTRLNQERTKAMMGIYSRGSAKRALGINGKKNREKAKAYIRDNNLRRIKTSEIIERRTGKLIEGMERSRISGNMRSYSERKRRRLAERYARQMSRSGTI